MSEKQGHSWRWLIVGALLDDKIYYTKDVSGASISEAKARMDRLFSNPFLRVDIRWLPILIPKKLGFFAEQLAR